MRQSALRTWPLLVAALALLLLAPQQASAGTQTFTTAGCAPAIPANAWTAPTGVGKVIVQAWGGGGGGGAATGSPARGGGGGGGGFSQSTPTVTPGSNYNLCVGAAGTAGATVAGGAGGNSTFAATTVVANGGGGGGLAAANGSNGTQGLGGAAGTGTTAFKGGDGSAAGATFSGGGGGGAGTGGAGGNTTTNAAGTGTATGGGAGGAGRTSNGAGAAGSVYGGGGGGGYTANATDRAGGAGAAGRVILTWNTPTVTTSAATGITASGATANGSVNNSGDSTPFTAVTFEYGLTTSYGTSVTATQSPVSGAVATAVSQALTGLACGTLYHFRAVGVNSFGTTNGSDLTFTTSNCPAPTVTNAFSPATIGAGGASTLTITITNNSSTGTLTGLAFSRTYSSTNLTNVAASVTNTCGGTATGTAGTRILSLTGGSLAPSSSCSVTVNVTSATAATYTNGAATSVTSTNAATGTAAAAATVIVKAVDPALSTVVAAPTTVGADNTLISTITVTLKNGAGTAVAGKVVTLAQTGTTTITTLVGTTNASGQATFTARSSTAQTSTYTATDTTDAVTVTQTASVTFVGPLPTVTTAAASSLTLTGATLNGTVNANGNSTAVTFQYGLSAPVYGSTVIATPSPITGYSATAVSAAVTGLTCGTTYHFRVVGTNTPGTSNGNDQTFTTATCVASAPTVSTDAASSVAATTATLNGTASSNGASTTVTFEYGTTVGYGSTAIAAQSPLATGASGAAVSAAVSSLSCNTLYHFRVKGVNTAGTSNGSDQTLTTTACVPTATTGTASAVVATTATLNGTVASNGASTTVSFDYGLTSLYGSSVTATPSPIAGVAGSANSTAVSAALTGLACNMTYHFRVNGVNSAGTSNGSDATFDTLPCAPTATTGTASGLFTDNGTAWFATLNGTVSSNGDATIVSFEYGTTVSYGNSATAAQSPLLAIASNSAVSADLVGLICSTTFHYRVVATNSYGTTYGSDSTFATTSCIPPPFAYDDCAATRFGKSLGCTANDVHLTGIQIAPGSISSCVSGTPVSLDLDLTVNFASPNRWDVGIFIAKDGKDPSILPASGGASTCTVDILPITPPASGYTFPDLDGAPKGIADTCGDGNGSINGGTGAGVKRMTNVVLPCYASPTSSGQLFVPYIVSWDNQASPTGGLCQSNQYPVPNTTSKCNAPGGTVSVAVVVMPKISKSHSGATFNPGDPISYTVTVFNDSGGTLQQSILKDPVVTGLSVTSISCATLNGSTCPTVSNTLADLQGAGIPIPSANLPNNSSLIYTVNGTLSGSVGTTIYNNATITIGSNTNTATDSVTLGAASGSKTFAPTTITEDNNSLLTITFTNPLPSPVTGVAFIDTYPSGLVNATTPSLSNSCGGSATATASGNQMTLTGGTIAASGSCSVSAYVTSSTANSYNNSVSFTPSSLGSTSATLGVTVPVFGAFNACNPVAAPNAACTSATSSTNSRISTQLAGTAFSLDIVALNTNGTRNTAYTNTVLVELLNSSDNSATVDSHNCRSSWTNIATLSPNPTFTGANNGLLAVGPFTVNSAYRDVRVRVTNVGGSSRTGCSTDNFSIRPSALTLSTTATAVAPSATVTPTIVAGAPFTLYATTSTGTNYTATLTRDVSKLTAQITSQDTSQQSGGTIGTLTPSTLTANSVASNNATYTEVGYLYLAPGAYRDDTFANVDAAYDCISSTATTDYLSDVMVGGKYGCSIGNKTTVSLGRFIPDHFGLTGTLQTRSDLLPATGSSFTYMDEPMKLALNLSAYAYSASEVSEITAVKTQNYAGSFAKLDAATMGTSTNWFNTGSSNCPLGTQCMGLGAANGATGLSNRLAIDTTSTGSSAPSNTPWASGGSTFTVYVKFARQTSPVDGPYGALKLGAMPRDSDGVTLPGPSSSDIHKIDLDATTGDTLASNPDSTNERKLLFTTDVRFGRLRLLGGYGSELLPLLVNSYIEYWNGTGWKINPDDSLTTIPINGVTATNGIAANTCFLTNPRPSAPTNAACLGSGSPAVTFSSGLGQWVVFDRTTPAVGYTDLAINLATMPWLRGYWSSAGAGHTENPFARIKFGSNKAPYIYLREKY